MLRVVCGDAVEFSLEEGCQVGFVGCCWLGEERVEGVVGDEGALGCDEGFGSGAFCLGGFWVDVWMEGVVC